MGCADIAVKKVVPGMWSSPSSEVVAIASRTEEKAAATARTLGIPRHHAGYEALLTDPEVDAVYIPLPNHLHLEWAVAAAEAGKHVLCEKPLALTAAEAREMAAACDEAGVLLMEAFMYRHHPQWMAVWDLLAEGRIGEPLAVQTIFSYRNVDPTDIRNQVATGGGAVYDIGCYAINVARVVFGGPPDRVLGVVRRDPGFGTDAVTSAVLSFGDRQSTFVVSTQGEDAQRVEILGTEGRVVVPIPFNIPPDRATVVDVIAGGNPPVAPTVQQLWFPAADQYGVQAELFARAVLEGGPAPVDPTDAVENLEVIEAIFAQA